MAASISDAEVISIARLSSGRVGRRLDDHRGLYNEKPGDAGRRHELPIRGRMVESESAAHNPPRLASKICTSSDICIAYAFTLRAQPELGCPHSVQYRAEVRPCPTHGSESASLSLTPLLCSHAEATRGRDTPVDAR